jgi:hypothetical protein
MRKIFWGLCKGVGSGFNSRVRFTERRSMITIPTDTIITIATPIVP